MILNPNKTPYPSHGHPPEIIMARFVGAVRRAIRLLPRQHSSETLIYGLRFPSLPSLFAASDFRFQTRTYNSYEILKTPFDSNVLRILQNEIDYLAEDAYPTEVFLLIPCLVPRNEGKEMKRKLRFS